MIAAAIRTREENPEKFIGQTLFWTSSDGAITQCRLVSLVKAPSSKAGESGEFEAQIQEIYRPERLYIEDLDEVIDLIKKEAIIFPSPDHTDVYEIWTKKQYSQTSSADLKQIPMVQEKIRDVEGSHPGYEAFIEEKLVFDPAEIGRHWFLKFVAPVAE